MSLLSDLRLTLRGFRKSKGFVTIAVFTLALGIGGTAAMFSVLDALALHPFKHPNSDRITYLWSGNNWPLSMPDFLDMREQADCFETLGCYSPYAANLGGDHPLTLRGALVTSEVLEAFGVQPIYGKLFSSEDNAPGAPSVAIISERIWRQNFDANPALLGKEIRINGGNTTLIGILPADFEFSSPWMTGVNCDIWQPLSLETKPWQRGSHNYPGVGLLKPGITIEEANAQVQAIGDRLEEEYPDSNTEKDFLLRSLHAEMTRHLGPQAWMLFAAVGLVLLVACTNVASMLLARASKRQGEFGIRCAIGAGKRDIFRLALLESLVLTVLGTLLSLFIAQAIIVLMRQEIPLSPMRLEAIALKPITLALTVGISLFATLLAGLPPAINSMRTEVSGMLSSIGGKGSVGTRSRHRFLASLIVIQIALAIILANAAVLFSSSYTKLLQVNNHFDTDHILVTELNPEGERYSDKEARTRFWEQLVERTAALPGVNAAGITSKLPLEGGSNLNYLIDNEPYDSSIRRPLAEISAVTPEYFKAANIPILKGRSLRKGDNEGDIINIVINQAMADKSWPEEDPLGRLVRGNNKDPWFTARVVGVVGNIRQWGPDQPVQPEIYWPPERAWGSRLNLILRSSRNTDFLIPEIRQVLHELDAELPISDTRTFRKVLADATSGPRVIAGLINGFMLAGLLLVAIGIFGTLSYNLSQRTREIGVRMALGAIRGDIIKLAFRQGGLWLFIGVIIGSAGAATCCWLVRSLVYDAGAFNPGAFFLGIIVVTTASAIACLIPSLQASRITVIQALRAD